MQMLIAGEWVSAKNGDYIEINNPYNGELVDRVPRAGLEDVKNVLTAAMWGKQEVAALPAHRRSEILSRTSIRIREQTEELANLLVQENGKTIRQCRFEIETTWRLFQGFAEEAKRITGQVIPMDAQPGLEDSLCFTMRDPVGIIVGIVPFNYPVELWAHKCAPALAAGNAAIYLLPPECPLTILKITEMLLNEGMPTNGIQCLTGYGHEIGESLLTDSRVNLITFTGSVPTGKKMLEYAVPTLKRVHLELGGTDPIIVCDDADLDAAAQAVVDGRLTNGAGQICCASKRIYVQSGIYDKFLEILIEKAQMIQLGDPALETTDIGPMIHARAIAKVSQQLKNGIEKGARVVLGGRVEGRSYMPTILVDVTNENPLVCEEVFGPVAPLIRFTQVENAIEQANGSEFGLQAAIFTENIHRALQAAKMLQAGGIIINGTTAFRPGNIPFGGYKQSGHGRESLMNTIQEMTEEKSVVIRKAFHV